MLKGGTPGLLIGLSSTVTATPATQKVQQKQLNDSSIPIAVSFNPDSLVAGEVISSDVLVKVTAQLSPGTYYINLYAKYLVDGQEQTVLLGVMTITVGQVAPIPGPMDKGLLAITQAANQVSIGGTEKVVVSLNDSTNVENLVVNISSADVKIATVSASTCTLSTLSNSCEITVTGVASGSVDINASATGYTTATTSVKVANSSTPPNTVIVGYGGVISNIDANGNAINRVPGTTNKNGTVLFKGKLVAVGWYGYIATSADLGATWKVESSLGNVDFEQIATDGNNLVAVGRNNTTYKGYVVHSSDGVNWTAESSNTNANNFFSVGYGNGKFILIDGGTYDGSTTPPTVIAQVASSSDGITWTDESSIILKNSSSIRSIAYGNGTYVATGTDCYTYVSTDGGNWTANNKGASNCIAGNALSIVYDSTRNGFISVSDRGDMLFFESTNLATPSAKFKTGDYKLHTVAVNTNGTVVAGGENGVIVSSINPGVSSNIESSGQAYDAIGGSVVVNSSFILVGRGVYTGNTAGTSWVQTLPALSDLNGVTYSSTNGFIALGGGNQWEGPSSVRQSTDGITWATLSGVSGFPSEFYVGNLTAANNKYFVLGNNGTNSYGSIVSSENGITWVEAQPLTVDSFFYNIAYGNGTYVVVGEDGDNNVPLIITSSNLTNWSAPKALSNPAKYERLYGVTYGNGKFVAVGSFGAVYTSSDNGETWINNKITGVSGFNYLFAVAFDPNNNRFVAVGGNSPFDKSTLTQLIYYSDDGVNWTAVTPLNNSSLASVSYSQIINSFVAVGADGTILKSTDGINWNIAGLPTYLQSSWLGAI